MSNAAFAETPRPPYYVVVFTSQRTPGDTGYGDRADRMMELATVQPGFLGVEALRNDDGFGLTISYWESEAAIAGWRANMEHRDARETGRQQWYERYELRVAKVERARSWRVGEPGE